jgi:pilus assembly protein CpaF
MFGQNGNRTERETAAAGPREPLAPGVLGLKPSGTAVPPAGGPSAPGRAAPLRPQYIELKANVHRKLLNRLNLEALASADRGRAEAEIKTLLFDLIAEEGTPLSLSERELIFRDVIDEVFGLGPLEALLRDSTVSDILVNTFKQVFVERNGVLDRVPTAFQDDRHLMRVIDRIVSAVGRRVDDSSPMVDARLPDGSRVNAIIPPLAVDGPLLSIRAFPAERLKANDLVGLRTLTQPMLDFLGHCVRSRLNCLVSGGTGAGKTTLLNVLSASSATGSVSQRSRTPPSCSSTRSTSCASRRGRQTSRARARFASGSS